MASNAESLIEAYAAIQSGFTALPFGLYDKDTPVGFAMIGYGSIGDEAEPSIVDDSCCLWRFMIDKNFQGRGYGKSGMKAVLDYIRTFPCGEAHWCWLSYEPDLMIYVSLWIADAPGYELLHSNVMKFSICECIFLLLVS